MATKFTKGQEVTVKAVVPQGPVEALRMDEDGNFFYKISWTDLEGQVQTRWFAEEDLE
jgi:uncharacterized protein YodC (DUF2158 family)